LTKFFDFSIGFIDFYALQQAITIYSLIFKRIPGVFHALNTF